METEAIRAELLEAALAYANYSWPVFAVHGIRDGRCTCGKTDCKSPGKHPCLKSWQNQATTDPDVIKLWWGQWPDANVGIATGAASGLVVLDVDSDHGGSEAALEREYGPLPNTMTVLTGSDGKHLYFSHPGELVRNRAGIVLGVDLRGDGGYVVAPPSLHISGQCYAWEGGKGLPDPTRIAPLPEWLTNLTRQPQSNGEVSERIPLHTRNSALTSLAGAMRRQGMTEDAICAALLIENEKRCDPPLDRAEVEGIARSVSRYDPVEKLNGRDMRALLKRCTDAGNAELLATLFGDRLRFDHRRKRWLVWRGHWWVDDADGEVVRLAKRAARRRYHLGDRIQDSDSRKRIAKWAINSESRSKLDAALALAQAEYPIADAGDGWDTDPYLFGVANGVIDLRTGKLREGKPEQRITMHSDITFDPSAECQRWDKFLDEVFEGDAELIDYVHRCVGYTLTGDTSEQCFFVLYGLGANGKSTLLEALRHVFGPFSFDPGFSAFQATRGGPPHPEQVAELAGRRFVTASETAEDSRLNEQRLKVLAHGDTTSAAFKYGKRFEFKPQGKVWLALNHKPIVRDDSLGFWRSVRLIPFRRQFRGDEADTELSAKLRAEATGILAWAVKGCLKWQEQGLGLPEVVRGATEDYEVECDPLSEFLEERCELGEGYITPVAELYQAYEEWAESQGQKPGEGLSKRQFGRRIAERFRGERTGPKRVRSYHGVQLVSVQAKT